MNNQMIQSLLWATILHRQENLTGNLNTETKKMNSISEEEPIFKNLEYIDNETFVSPPTGDNQQEEYLYPDFIIRNEQQQFSQQYKLTQSSELILSQEFGRVLHIQKQKTNFEEDSDGQYYSSQQEEQLVESIQDLNFKVE